MSLAYLLGGMIFGALSALIWIIAGGAWAGAFAVYLVAGQIGMAALVAHVAMSPNGNPQ